MSTKISVKAGFTGAQPLGREDAMFHRCNCKNAGTVISVFQDDYVHLVAHDECLTRTGKTNVMFTYHIISDNEFTMVMPEHELGYDDRHALANIVSRHMGPGMILSFDMGKVSFIDSADVGFLVQMKNLAEKCNGSFEMCHLSKRVKWVIDKLALNEFLNVSHCGTCHEKH